MNDKTQATIPEAINCLNQGGIIAYPTEAVYGLGCDPFNANAVAHLLSLKHRALKKGFILIASDWQQIKYLVTPIEPRALAQVFATWPGPVTWLFPATHEVPKWIRGEHTTVAVRITAHPVAKQLCEKFGNPIVSTSANIEGYPPARDARTLQLTFGKKIDLIVAGKLGSSPTPTQIRDAITGEIIRSA